ncbi:hypothetical protein IQ07DRAFT_254958 [Pyrenochaeta sp. DS3sAY3a]|nr:hypothetical protein IQ07DRAFT_254958 [Pyrenochaeta sp. DS3sAY3a]
MAQFGDLPQIDDSRFNFWSVDHECYMQSYKQHNQGYNTEDEMYLEDFENGTVNVPSMQRFMTGPSPLTAGLLQAKIPLQRHQDRQFEQQWPPVDCLRMVSPDRTSASGNSSYAPQNELHSPNLYHSIPYGSPNEYSQASLPYPSTEHYHEHTFLTGTAFGGGSISLKEIEYEHQPEPVIEEIETVDLRQESLCDHENSVKVETTSYKYADSGIGNSVRDAESVQPIDSSEDPTSDSDYSPSSRSGKRRRSSASNGSGRGHKRRVPVRKDSHVSTSPTLGRAPRKSRGGAASAEATLHFEDKRPFPCPLASYGCNSNFSSKNEWKRHVSTQHIKLSYWRCDLCTPTTDPNDDNTFYHNDFNRKDLFTQHLRRMHAAPKDSNSRNQKQYPVTEDNLQEHQSRCLLVLRSPPQQSTCLFCHMTFSGPTSWDDRMEHVGRHLEKDRKTGADMLDPIQWNTDQDLEQYLVEEGLIVTEKGSWRIGDGKPKRQATVESDDESVGE